MDNLEGMMLNEMSQAEKDKNHMVSLVYETKKSQALKQGIEWWLPGIGVWGKWGRC